MDRNDVREFFDSLASKWDAAADDKPERIERILDAAGIADGMTVLDIGCGTGVMFPFYLKRGAKSVTGADLSAEMLREAKAKFGGDSRVSLIECDAQEEAFPGKFDRCVIYNAFPHFGEPEKLLTNLASVLVDGGRLTIAHGKGRSAINAHHSGSAHHVSMGLIPARELAALFAPLFTVDVTVDEEDIYIVSGVKK